MHIYVITQLSRLAVLAHYHVSSLFETVNDFSMSPYHYAF